MKKLFAVLFVAAALVAGAFAEGIEDFPKGSWIDENYDAEWIFGAGTIELKDAKTGEHIIYFRKEKMENFKVEATADGLALSFYYADTERAYKFIKPVSLSADLTLIINPDWQDNDYKTTIKFKKIF